MFNKFIHRPVLSIVISLLILIFGLLALTQLPVTQFPSITPPEVTVTTKYMGANSETCVKAVVTPLERAINGVPGMAYMSSVSGNDGSSAISIVFKAGVDPEIAAVNVQNRVSAVIDELPQEVIKSGVIVEKVQNSMLMYLNILTDDEEMDEKFLFNYTDINLLAEIKRIEGVGYAKIMGSTDYAMRIWLNPTKMTAFDISTDDVVKCLKQQNIEAAPGKVGESSGKKTQSLQYVVKYSGKFNKAEQYENIVIKSTVSGEALKLKDIAQVEFGSQEYDVISKENGKPSAAIMIKQRPGSNAQKVIENIKIRMEELKVNFPPGMSYTIGYDVSAFLDASIHEVIKTLVEAFILVSLVVFIFLQDWRSTLIPVITVPVSLIGTFFFMNMLGFSLNLITLFSLVLAIGIVVDDAIVVVEAVHAKMEDLHLGPKEATELAMSEISGAIIAITLVMSAVFVPASFIPGPTGVFYREFSLTMAISIVLSGVVALTLTPALCSIILVKHEKEENNENKSATQKFFDLFNNLFTRFENKYEGILKVIANRRVVTFSILAVFVVLSGILGKLVATGFIPNEDQGTIYANITSPSGSTLQRTEAVADEIQKVAQSIDGVATVSTLAGFSIITDGSGAAFGMNLISLSPWNKRTNSDKEIIDILNEKTSHIKDAKIEFMTPPPVPGYGSSSGYELRLLDKTGKGDLKALETVAVNFTNELNKRPEIINGYTTFDASYPQLMVNIDYLKAAQKDVVVEDILSTLQTMLGSEYASNFIRFGQLYRVMVQASPEYRAKPEDILKLHVKNRQNQMVPISAFVTLTKVYGPELVTRYNMYLTAILGGEPAPGYSSGDVINAIKETAKEKLPKGYDYDWAGSSRDQANSGSESAIIFAICLLFVYLLLSAQYESFLLPWSVILSLPTGVFGAFFMLSIMGLENNIYAQIALIMLIGLLGKNAILIIEFATLKQKEGASALEAAIAGAKTRLRPILMTSFAFNAGLIPLMMATGAGAIGNRTIGSAAAGGMLLGTIFGIVIIPGLYVVFATLGEKLKKPETPLTETL
jgi:HAE1 family hydrophobic/amphiphilic exporter-1